jgi:asparagine synthase (glutamine-hydrolysing)
VALSHTRLSIIDLAGGDQPMHSADGTLSLCANGEIYNYLELREELKERGCVFATNSDSECILQAYRAYGLDCVHSLHGMFAIALYDKQEGRLLLARDRLGIKPLYYAFCRDKLVFASEIKALLPLLDHAPDINISALNQFMQNQFQSGEETIIRGVYRVLPGEMLSVGSDLHLRRTEYWSALATEPREMTYTQAQEEFDNLFPQVLQEHLRSDVPYGLFLSGGVDSAVLLAMLHRYQDKTVRTFSIGFKDSAMRDELEEASFISGKFPTQHTPIRIDQDDLFRRVVYSVWTADELMRDYAQLPTMYLAEQASRELKVVLTGEGGDEVFAGYGRYRGGIESWMKGLLAPDTGGFRTRGQMRGHWLRRIYGPELRAVQGDFRDPFVRAYGQTPKYWSGLQRRQYTDIATALPDNLLLKVDKMLMGFGLEGRVPFLDHRIVRFGLSLPDELKIRSGQGKAFLRQWAKQYLPGDYLNKKKSGFHVPVADWLSGSFLDSLREHLPRHRGIREYFRHREVSRLLERHKQKGGLTREAWSLMQFAIWFNLFIERDRPLPTPEENPLNWLR